MDNNTQWKITKPQKSVSLEELSGIERYNDIEIDEKETYAFSSRRNRKKKKAGIKIPSVMIALMIAFLIMLGLLFIRSWIVSLNEDVRYLQSELDTINAEIDSKSGRLISNADLKSIEAQARALGMKEADPSQYVYESAAKKQTTLSNSPVGLYDYISFLIQLRNENLWPVEQ